ncbi:GxxExxY protein [Formivibrio citricus]|uniref:GxxExxY protein n=1 Tax=Formivibrio citricus TaxID=83765 RepID=A0A1I4XG44_9NEIS|nr:GxxExxY protein [Formivibrio citricus]SFN24239.1 GxxExxY protein [Formivibrio citricus]
MEEQIEATAKQVVDAALCVHRALGPGLLESAYEQCLKIELINRGLTCETQQPIAIDYYGQRVEMAFRADMIVNGVVLVELKSVERIQPIHEAQLLTYLKLSDLRVGFLINFNTKLLKEGLKRMAL